MDDGGFGLRRRGLVPVGWVAGSADEALPLAPRRGWTASRRTCWGSRRRCRRRGLRAAARSERTTPWRRRPISTMRRSGASTGPRSRALLASRRLPTGRTRAVRGGRRGSWGVPAWSRYDVMIDSGLRAVRTTQDRRSLQPSGCRTVVGCANRATLPPLLEPTLRPGPRPRGLSRNRPRG